MQESSIDSHPRIFGSRFLGDLKKVGERFKNKSRLVAQNYADEGAATIATKAPTVQLFSQLVALCLAASMPSMSTYSRDITQSYIQLHTPVDRDVYIRARAQLGLIPRQFRKVSKPLYGIPESGLDFYQTYLAHYLELLEMRRTRAYPCLLVYKTDGKMDGLFSLQVDDSLGIGTRTFLKNEETAAKFFRSKPPVPITSSSTSFNGLVITRSPEGIFSTTQK